MEPYAARSIARFGQNVPAGGPPLQRPLLSPGTCSHIHASARGKPVWVVGRGPIDRFGGLHRSSLPCLTGCGFFLGPFPFSEVFTMKWAPPVSLETFSAHLTSSIVQLRWVSFVKKPRTLRTPAAFSAFAV